MPGDVIRYGAVFFGVMFLHEFVLVPSLYLGWVQVLHLGLVVALIIAAEIIADTATYIIGRYIPREKILKIPGMRRKEYLLERLSHLFDTHGHRVLFLSRFVLGTRMIVQFLCGMHRVPYWRYIVTSIAGSTVWVLSVLTVIALVNASLGKLETLTGHIQVVLTLTIGIALVAHFGLTWLLRRVNGTHGDEDGGPAAGIGKREEIR